jgi:hypothetical protein
MQKLNEFLAQHASKIIIILLVLTWSKSCSVDSELTKVKKHLAVIDSLPTQKDLKIEGLKAEKRMIQATDRKMLDVQRQSQIDEELKQLGK